MRPELEREPPHRVDVRVGVGREAVDGHDGRQAELVRDAEVAREVRRAFADVAVPVVARRLHGRDEDDGARLQPAEPADDVEELLEAHVRGEAALGDDDVAELERHPVATSELLPWAMFANGPQWTNAGLPSSVWTRFGFSASFEQHRHRAGRAEPVGRDGLLRVAPTVIAPSRRRRSARSRDMATIAIVSEAAVMSNPVCRG